MKGVIFMSIIKQRLMDHEMRQTKRDLIKARIKACKNAGYSNAEISKKFGLAESTIRTII